MDQKGKVTIKNKQLPNLKQGNGSGFSFEDEVASYLMCEMLLRKASSAYGVIVRLERQATDWEPCGDFLLTFRNPENEEFLCGCSVKSNRPITGNGCSEEIRDSIWRVVEDDLFDQTSSLIGLFTAPLSATASLVIDQLVSRARNETNPNRFESKTLDKKHRDISESFRHPARNNDTGSPWQIFSRLIAREFDFIRAESKCLAEAKQMCREILEPTVSTDLESDRLWQQLLVLAKSLRDNGGSVTRDSLVEKLRSAFVMRNDPYDEKAWAILNQYSDEYMSEVITELPGHLQLPREDVFEKLRSVLSSHGGLHLLGESGSGKSVLAKKLAQEMCFPNGQVVWFRADRVSMIRKQIPDVISVLDRTRHQNSVLIIDSLESCYDIGGLNYLSQLLEFLGKKERSPWKVILLCQPVHWERVFLALRKHGTAHAALTEELSCGEISQSDLKLVCEASPSIGRLRQLGYLNRVLRTPKMLDVLLSGEDFESRELAGEADLVTWWWKDKIQGMSTISKEETTARNLAAQMAQDLVSEVPHEAVQGHEESVGQLIDRGVLLRTREGRIRFSHDLYADWSRVMILREKKYDLIEFALEKVSNPPWIRALRLHSQFLLEREEDISQWQSIIAACIAKRSEKGEFSSEVLNIIDSFVEAIPLCTNSEELLEKLKADLLANNGFLLNRMMARTLIVGTVPDPVLRERFAVLDRKLLPDVARQYRLPRSNFLDPVILFLLRNKDEAIKYVPYEIAEIALMYARLESYRGDTWKNVAELALLNAERLLWKETDRYRLRNKSKDSKIYEAGIRAASQCPERVQNLLLKACGRAPWMNGDVSPQADMEWLGEWKEYSFGGYQGRIVANPPESWGEGPSRKTSEGLADAWFQGDASYALYERYPSVATEITLAFLIDWPKVIIDRDFYYHGYDHHGLAHAAEDFDPVFWTTGPFINYLRGNWKIGVDLIVKLANFATDRYEEWWPYEETLKIRIHHNNTELFWNGNAQVYGWHQYYMNTAKAVTCALMALERWFDEKIDQDSVVVTEAIDFIYKNCHSLAIIGVLIAVGKRHPKLFLKELKPLLFARELYLLDVSLLMNRVSARGWREDEVVFKLRSEWESLPGRRESLQDCCIRWLLTSSEFRPIFDEVAASWRTQAESLGDDERQALLRWASSLDASHYSLVELPGGAQAWQQQIPAELRDLNAADDLLNRQALLTYPYQCSDLLQNRGSLNEVELEQIWDRLHEWDVLEETSKLLQLERASNSDFLDHRHSRAALLAVLLRFGEDWLLKLDRRAWVENEVRKLLNDPVAVHINSSEELHEDFESYLARCVVRCWANDPDRLEWKSAIVEFVTAIRYRTVEILFEEAYRVKEKLQIRFDQLETLALSFAAARQHYNLQSMPRPRPEILEAWHLEWKPKFLSGQIPAKIDRWAEIPLQNPGIHGLESSLQEFSDVARRKYGLDGRMLIAIFGNRNSLDKVGLEERKAQFHQTSEILQSYLETLPLDKLDALDDFKLEVNRIDRSIFDLVANRLYECTSQEQDSLCEPIIRLPAAAYEVVADFLLSVIVAARMEADRVSQLIPLWMRIVSRLENSHHAIDRRNYKNIMRTLLLYGVDFVTFRDKVYVPLVNALRPHYLKNIDNLSDDAYLQGRFAAFLVSEAGKDLLVESMGALFPTWKDASNRFWKEVADIQAFTDLLELANTHLAEVRSNEAAFAGYKLLTQNLAALRNRTALQIQQEFLLNS